MRRGSAGPRPERRLFHDNTLFPGQKLRATVVNCVTLESASRRSSGRRRHFLLRNPAGNVKDKSGSRRRGERRRGRGEAAERNKRDLSFVEIFRILPETVGSRGLFCITLYANETYALSPGHVINYSRIGKPEITWPARSPRSLT